MRDENQLERKHSLLYPDKPHIHPCLLLFYCTPLTTTRNSETAEEASKLMFPAGESPPEYLDGACTRWHQIDSRGRGGV